MMQNDLSSSTAEWSILLHCNVFSRAGLFANEELYSTEFLHGKIKENTHVAPGETLKHSWDAKLQTLEGHSGSVLSIAFSPDGKTLASGAVDGIKIWDTLTGKEQIILRSSSTYSVAFSPCGQTVVSGSADGTKIWDSKTGKNLITIQLSAISSVTVSPDGQTVASISDNESIQLWDATTGIEQQTLCGHSNLIKSVAFSSDGQTVASGSYDKTIKLWDVTTGKEKQTLCGHSDEVS